MQEWGRGEAPKAGDLPLPLGSLNWDPTKAPGGRKKGPRCDKWHLLSPSLQSEGTARLRGSPTLHPRSQSPMGQDWRGPRLCT